MISKLSHIDANQATSSMRYSLHEEYGFVRIVFSDKKWDVADIPNVRKQLEHTIGRLVEPKIVLDFKNVEYVPVTALGMFAAVCCRVRRQDGEVSTANLNSNINDLFVVTKLDRIFVIKETAA